MTMWRFADLRRKEVINIRDGARLGYVYDIEISAAEGRIEGIVVPGPRTFFGLFAGSEDYIISWEEIEKIGEDIILVSVQLSERRGQPSYARRPRAKKFTL